MKVLLMSLPTISPRNDNEDITYGESLALLYLANALKAHGIDVELWDSIVLGAVAGLKGVMYRASLDKKVVIGAFPGHIDFRIDEYKPDILGISIQFTSNYGVAKIIAKETKKKYPHIIIVAGGPHVTLDPASVIADKNIDYAIAGEGEITFPALIKAIEAGKMDPDIPGVWHKNKSMDFEIIDNIDNIAPPDWSLLPMEFMFWCNSEGRILKLYTSRGCTFNCAFCSTPLTSKRRFRAHSPERVLAEIDWVVEKYDAKGVMFEDDNMTLNLNRFHDIMEGIVKYELYLAARNFRCDLLPKETLELMKVAGFKEIWITPESGNQRVLNEVIGKHLDIGDVYQTLANIVDVGLSPAVGLVIGMAGETKAEIMDTIRFAFDLKDKGANKFWISIATPIKGTRLYDECIRRGYKVEVDNFGYAMGSFDTEYWTAEELTQLRQEMMEDLNA
jgi:anaerobic magnesium-protoporphyrin IX monomethyl ester cyclase